MSRSRGPKKAAPRKFNEKVHVEAFASVLEPAVMTQAKQLAGMPFIHPHVALMRMRTLVWVHLSARSSEPSAR